MPCLTYTLYHHYLKRVLNSLSKPNIIELIRNFLNIFGEIDSLSDQSTLHIFGEFVSSWKHFSINS